MAKGIKVKNQEELEYILADAWLNIDVKEQRLYNPLAEIPPEFGDDPHLYILWLMSRPEYFSFVCKEILNVELLPVQAIILKELWQRRFPMLICSRGFGKCERDSYIQKEDGFVKINDLVGEDYPDNQKKIVNNLSLLGENGYNSVEYCWSNGYSETRKIETAYGFQKEGTPDHPIRCVSNGEIVWKHLKDFKIDDYIVIDRSGKWFPKTNDIDVDTAYLFGCLVGDGGYTVRGRISFTTADVELVDVLNKTVRRLWNKEFKDNKHDKYGYLLYGTWIWDELFEKYGFNSPVCGEKDFPSCILSAKKDSAAAFIRGLFDTDGTVDKGRISRIEFASKSKNLVKTLQFMLTKFGIVSRVKKRLNKKYQRYYYYLYIFGDNVKIFNEEIGFGLERKQKRLDKLATYNSNPNKDILPHSLVLHKLLHVRKVFASDYKFGDRSYNYERGLTSPSRLKAYQLSYHSFKKILDIFARVPKCTDMPEYQDLLKIYTNHYFYDKVVDVSKGFNKTFDVHIPNDHSFIADGFISHNTYLGAVYAWLRMLFLHNRKIIIAGSVFRQSKLVFEYMETIWNNAPLLRDLVGLSDRKAINHGNDRWTFTTGLSHTYAIPVGAGDKIRGYRANDILMEEFASINREVFETIIAGFGAVTATPVENVKKEARLKKMREMGIELIEDEDDLLSKGNQLLISGTASYDFNHYAEYWKKWREIINSKGDKNKIAAIMKNDDYIDDNFNWKDYSIIRIPIELVPKGFMDDASIARSRATMHTGTFAMEYGAIFSRDSKGFFKRSLIESCVVSEKNPIVLPGSGEVLFTPLLRGKPGCRYVMGVDVAIMVDLFAIVILEIHEDHKRIVYLWTTDKKSHSEELKNGLVDENNFYVYCARKIRDLMKSFNIERIAIDSQGGGFSVMEAFNDDDKIESGEHKLYPIIDEDKEKDTDGMHGLHIVDVINFASSEWTGEANHGMKKDFETGTLLFPFFDPISLGMAEITDNLHGRYYDTLEECTAEIEELKSELTQIIMTQTVTGRDKWDTPEIKEAGNRKGRLRKDRYSALLMGNATARHLQKMPPPLDYEAVGGFAGNTSDDDGPLYVAPQWFANKIDGVY